MKHLLPQLRHWWGGGEYIPEFEPRVYFHSDAGITDIVLEDTVVIWCRIGEGIDGGYAFDDGRLVAIRIWSDVRSRPKREASAA